MAAYHCHETSILGTDIPTRDRRIDAVYVAFLGLVGYFDGQARTTSGMVDEVGALFHVLDDPVGSQTHAFYILRVAEHHNENVDLFGHLDGSGELGACFDAVVGFRGSPVKALHGVAFANQVLAHGGAHDAGANPAD